MRKQKTMTMYVAPEQAFRKSGKGARTPTKLTPLKIKSVLTDDIEVGEWLDEIGMKSYADTFKKNFSIDGGNYLSRKKLSQLKMHHYPFMNIENYSHQKILQEHVQHTLLFAYGSPLRKKEANDRLLKHFPKKEPIINNKDTSKPTSAVQNTRDSLSIRVGADAGNRADHKGKVHDRRRRSFDHDVWDHINKLRHHDLKPVELLREGSAHAPKKETKEHAERRRRWSFGEDLNTDNKISRAKAYGNSALDFDILQKELLLLQKESLDKYKSIINCDKATIFFVHEKSRELILCAENNVWFRLPAGSGLAGHCAETGECLNVVDAYEDYRFNRNVDIQTGFRTRNVLCQPLRSHRGGGSVIGVIQMINKHDNLEFDAHDEELLAACVQKIADEINARFKELLHAAEKFVGFSTFIGDKGGHLNSPNRVTYNKPTAASRNSSVDPNHVINHEKNIWHN